jgi:hypothetical protein
MLPGQPPIMSPERANLFNRAARASVPVRSVFAKDRRVWGALRLLRAAGDRQGVAALAYRLSTSHPGPNPVTRDDAHAFVMRPHGTSNLIVRMRGCGATYWESPSSPSGFLRPPCPLAVGPAFCSSAPLDPGLLTAIHAAATMATRTPWARGPEGEPMAGESGAEADGPTRGDTPEDDLTPRVISGGVLDLHLDGRIDFTLQFRKSGGTLSLADLDPAHARLIVDLLRHETVPIWNPEKSIVTWQVRKHAQSKPDDPSS